MSYQSANLKVAFYFNRFRAACQCNVRFKHSAERLAIDVIGIYKNPKHALQLGTPYHLNFMSLFYSVELKMTCEFL